MNLAKAGADFVPPVISVKDSTKQIRSVLDTNGFTKTKIMPYSAKFASSFYSPYRQTIGFPLTFGGKDMYQIDPLDFQLAVNILLEDSLYSDILMIKPGLLYMDILIKAKKLLPNKIFAMYHVSGKYQMLKIASKQGIIDWQKSLIEIYHSFQRVELDYLITYAAKDLAKM